jgi:hypothetical protein
VGGGARLELYMVAVEGVASGVRDGSRNAVGEESVEGVKELRPGRERLGADSWRLMCDGGAKGCC